jgi:flagellin
MPTSGQLNSCHTSSRFAIAAQTLATRADTTRAAESRIKDADIASESARLVSIQILQQSASADLAQADQQPAIALQLLRAFP